MRGSLSPSALAKNKRIVVFRLVSERTDFSSEKSSCYRPTSEGICFAKQSEQWVTKPLLSQAKLARAFPKFRPILLRKLFYSLFYSFNLYITKTSPTATVVSPLGIIISFPLSIKSTLAISSLGISAMVLLA